MKRNFLKFIATFTVFFRFCSISREARLALIEFKMIKMIEVNF
jgi:hypothetical protein